MNSGLQHVQERYMEAAAQHLQRAAIFAELHFKNATFKKNMGKGANAVLVEFALPGVLSVYDPATGHCLARSAPGELTAVCKGFIPSLPGGSHESGH